MHTKTDNKKNIKDKNPENKISIDTVRDMKESIEDYKMGRYVKGDVKDIMKSYN